MIEGREVEVKGYADLEWTLGSRPGIGDSRKAYHTRFFVPKVSKPPFDAVFSKATAQICGITG